MFGDNLREPHFSGRLMQERGQAVAAQSTDLVDEEEEGGEPLLVVLA